MSQALRLFLILSMIVAFVPREALGVPCHCAAPAPPKTEKAKPPKCPCCQPAKASECDRSVGTDLADDSSSVPQPAPAPCSSKCVAWCCCGGFLPLTIIVTTPSPLDLAPESAVPQDASTPSDGCPLRIEHPPRLLG